MLLFEQFANTISAAEVTTANAVFKLLLSAFLGGAIGFERKRKGQIAGSRTFALISMGATLAMLVSIAIPQLYPHFQNGDPARVAAQVISGIGFLGAGAIIQTKSSIRGLTTAAGIWVAAGIGLAVGLGLYFVAIAAMILILSTLILLDYYEHRLRFEWESIIIKVSLPAIIESFEPYRKVFEAYNIKLHEWYVDYDYNLPTTTIDFVVQMRGRDNVLQLLAAIRQINPTDSITLQNEIK